MEIEFNPNVGKSDPVRPAPRQAAVRPLERDASFQTEALEKKLQEIPLVRPDVVERARTLVADIQYPPDQVLTSLATLLALKLSN